MKYDTIFDLLRSFASQKAGGDEIRSLHYLYGFAQLLAMKPEIIKSFLDSEEDYAEYERLRQVAGEKQIDINMLKQGITLLMMEEKGGNQVQDILDSVKNETEDGYKIPVDVFFDELLKKESHVGELFANGKSLDDVVAYVKQKHPAVEPEEREKTVEATPAVKQEKKAEAPVIQEAKAWERWNDLAVKGRDLFKVFKERIHGQDDAIRKFVQGYFQAEVFVGADTEKVRPKGIFLFAGPPGVGKTYLATTAAKVLKLPVKRFNMSEYADHQSQVELIGLSKKYSGAKQGALTSFVKENPKSIIIFDEVEKAHLNVIHLFLQILDAGVLQDSYDEKDVSFTDTLIIFTTNVGKKLYEENREQNLSLLSQSVILDALSSERHPVTGHEMFPAAICSRFATGNVIMFNHLKGHYLSKIASQNFEKCAELFQKKYEIALEYDHQMPSLFLFHMSNNMDARIISSQSGLFVQNELYEFARQTVDQVDFGKLEKIKFEMALPEDDPKIMSLFMKEYSGDIIILGDPSIADGMCVEDKIHIHFAKDWSDIENLAGGKDIHFVVIDPMHGYHHGKEDGYFSMEDYDTEGIRCFELMNEKMPDMPVYMLEKENPMREVDKNTFQQMGARGIISCLEGVESFEQTMKALLETVYLQKKVDELSRQSKVLDYNTAQMVSEDGKTATVLFHSFKLHTAVNADSRNTVMTEAETPKVRFSDIIGAVDAREELKYFIKYLKNPKEFMLKGAKPPKGVLLYGPPGTGKTMLAKAMAGEAGVTFLPTTATSFMKKYVGEGEETIRTLFKTAKKYAPAVIFIDEIDAIGKERTGSQFSSSTETLLNTLLTEMDGFSFDPSRPVFVLAATNFPLERSKSNGGAIIDPALLRRFDNKIYVDLPNRDERKEFIEKRIKTMDNCDLSEDVINNIASRTTGESLAIIQNILELALRNAKKADVVLTDEVLLNAMEEYNYGEEHKWGRDYYESVAHHEAGHAYISYLSGKHPSFVTIVSRGDFGGYMQSSSEGTSGSYTRAQLLWMIRTSLAGRAAEIVFYGEESGINTGVSSDLESATNIALQMVCRYGMSGKSLISISPDKVFNSAYGMRMLEEVEEILDQEMKTTIKLVEEGRDKIEALASALLEKNQIMGDEIERIFER